MVLYLIIQTIFLSVAFGFHIYAEYKYPKDRCKGEWQREEYQNKLRSALFDNISEAIVIIFFTDVAAVFVFSLK